jgi:2-polyprenyl-3-methyl-5-hydroxy-6-metoxy-1,4-benzoquinol methylase
MDREISAPNLVCRRAHVATDRSSRLAKGQKIEAILSRRLALAGKRLLDIGAGSGYIAAYFKDRGLDVVAVDRERHLAEGIDVKFCETTGVDLPFEPESFDVVLYNHVIEHVGERPEQRAHLAEIYRVLKPAGVLYLAVPNRWSLLEPHYKLPLLSWLPAGLASAYVRLTGRGTWYDCRPYGAHELWRTLNEAGYSVEDVTFEALAHYLEQEAGEPWSSVVPSHPPVDLFKIAKRLMPTLIHLGIRQ